MALNTQDHWVVSFFQGAKKMYSNDHSGEGRVKTPIPEKLKNSYSFAQNNGKEEVSDSNDVEEMENFAQPETHYSENQDPNTLDHTMQDQGQIEREATPENENLEKEQDENRGEVVDTKRKRKKRPKRRVEEPTEKPGSNEENNTSNMKSSMPRESVLNIELPHSHYFAISPNDIINSKNEDIQEANMDDQSKEVIPTEKPQTKKLFKAFTGPMSQRQKVIFMESKLKLVVLINVHRSCQWTI